jgi:hypothetical protein
MTQIQIQFIFETLKEMREDIKELKKFKNYCQGVFWALATMGTFAYFILRIIEVVKL